MNTYAIQAIYNFEMSRWFRTIVQSIISPVIVTSLEPTLRSVTVRGSATPLAISPKSVGLGSALKRPADGVDSTGMLAVTMPPSVAGTFVSTLIRPLSGEPSVGS